MRFRQQPGTPPRTLHLEFAYAPRDFRAMRASWKITTEDAPEPDGVNLGLVRKLP